MRPCCGQEPQIFRDRKVGHEGEERMWVVACGVCGKFMDAATREQAMLLWNGDYKKRQRRPRTETA